MAAKIHIVAVENRVNTCGQMPRIFLSWGGGGGSGNPRVSM